MHRLLLPTPHLPPRTRDCLSPHRWTPAPPLLQMLVKTLAILTTPRAKTPGVRATPPRHLRPWLWPFSWPSFPFAVAEPDVPVGAGSSPVSFPSVGRIGWSTVA